MDYDAIVKKTILITQSLDAIGRLSCNPAIGGLAKGNIVREIDALGGEMGHLIDSSMIQFRVLNKRRGPAVQAPRAQADKFTSSNILKDKSYSFAIRIVKLNKYLIQNKKEFILSKQILKCQDDWLDVVKTSGFCIRFYVG